MSIAGFNFLIKEKKILTILCVSCHVLLPLLETCGTEQNFNLGFCNLVHCRTL